MAVPDEVADGRPVILVAMEGSPLLAGLLAALDGDVRVVTCAGGAAAVRQSQHPADVVVIDADAGPRRVATTCRRIRAASSAAIIATGSSTDEMDVAGALDAGADDYVPMPVGGGELAARIRSLLRRAPPSGDERIVAGRLAIDQARHLALLDDTELPLTAAEFALLATLARNRDRVVMREDLLARIGAASGDGTQRRLRVALSRLRAKLRSRSRDDIGIDAVAGVGYQLVVRGRS